MENGNSNGWSVSGCEIATAGTTRVLVAVGFEKTTLHFILSSHDLIPEDVEKVSNLSEIQPASCGRWLRQFRDH